MMKRLMFTKMVQSCGLGEAAAHAKALGFDGVDLTVRDQGHVLPEDVRDGLPAAVEIFRRHGLDVPMISTGVTTGDEVYAKDLFDTAGRCGVKYVKVGYWWLGEEPYGKYLSRFEDAARGVSKIEALAKDAGVCAIIHTHSGACVSAVAAYVRQLLEGRNHDHIGAYVDVGHLVVEGGFNGWVVGMELLAPYLKVVAVKNFIWRSEQRDNYVNWFWKVAPLAAGIAPWPKALEILKAIGFDGYISIHSEYLDANSWNVLSQEECLAQTAEDLRYLDTIGFH